MRDPVIGDRIDRYELTELIARCGMASIWKAVDLDRGCPVALKIPHLQYESDVVFYERFRREEEIGQRIVHPNIVRVLGPREKSRVYMAMEYVEGRSLRAVMQEKGRLPTSQALSIACRVCDALAYLHAQGVFHRDIKPENIFLTTDGQVKILDFGIALLEAARRLTWAGLAHAIGTPEYMAPEQIRGRRGDACTDIYALGMVLYEMLTGAQPYESSTSLALLHAKVNEEPRPPSYHLPGFDPSLEAVLLKAIERSPRDRYQCAEEFLFDLQNPSAVRPRPPLGRTRHRGLRLPRRIAFTLVVAAILAGLGSLVWLSARAPGERQRPVARAGG